MSVKIDGVAISQIASKYAASYRAECECERGKDGWMEGWMEGKAGKGSYLGGRKRYAN